MLVIAAITININFIDILIVSRSLSLLWHSWLVFRPSEHKTTGQAAQILNNKNNLPQMWLKGIGEHCDKLI